MTTRALMPRLVATGATLALALSLSACGDGNGGGSSDDDRIHVLVYGDATNKVEQQIVDTFNKTSDVKAVLDTIPGADYQKKLQTIISTPQAPDIFYNWGGGSIKPFVKADLLMPLDDFIKKDPDLEKKFLQPVWENAVIDGKPYGVPMRGTQPVLLFHNKNVLDKAGVQPPKTWDELLDAVGKLKDAGVTPIALGGGDVWPTQMWFQYLYDRIAGPELFAKAVGGDKSAWESADSKKALDMIKQLVDSGAFGKNYDSVKYTNGGSVQLVASGKAGFELMGSWYFSQQLTDHKEFAEKGLGYSTFPTVQGGKGDPANVAGNPNNYYSVMKKTKHPEAVAEFLKLMYSDEFVKAQLEIGNLPTTTNTNQFIDTSGTPEYSHFQYDLVSDAPHFQLSWDQAYPQKASSDMYKAIQQFFSGTLDTDGFIKAMQALPTE
ncbi:ABC transporter substrate-binding protein [Streptomyces sp. enrichment culture]|uniref:ABC transporter substrate-binding protein n=1 Tax=Streptomyces sp. enrichment culture TaxID=1795815 RepID=UPI003F54A930